MAMAPSSRLGPVGQVSLHNGFRVCSLSRRRHVKTYAAKSEGMITKLARVFSEKAKSDYERVFGAMDKTRERLSVADELFTYWQLDEYEEALEELEDVLLTADFGPKTAARVCDSLRVEIKAGKVSDGSEVKALLKENIRQILTAPAGEGGSDNPLSFPDDAEVGTVLVVGVNGAGKTTTIGKLAHRLTSQGVAVALAAGDTYRAAATEQLVEWGKRTDSPVVVKRGEKEKPPALLYRALEETLAAHKNGEGTDGYADVLVCDTSGRLHTNYDLMEELGKCQSSMQKVMPGSPHETLLVLDGTTGLNMLNQAKEFASYVNLTGLILTKLDGTSRGGAVVSVVDEVGVPVRFVGVGEKLEDLQSFDADSFVDAILPAGI